MAHENDTIIAVLELSKSGAAKFGRLSAITNLSVTALVLEGTNLLEKCIGQLRLGRSIASLPYNGEIVVASVDSDGNVIEVLFSLQMLEAAKAKYT